LANLKKSAETGSSAANAIRAQSREDEKKNCQLIASFLCVLAALRAISPNLAPLRQENRLIPS
jgi:hypothetical protein